MTHEAAERFANREANPAKRIEGRIKRFSRELSEASTTHERSEELKFWITQDQLELSQLTS